MATIDEMMDDLRQADAAGDTELANHIASLIRQAQSASAPPPQQPKQAEPSEPSDAAKLAANPLVRFATSAASPIMGAGEWLPGALGQFFAENNAELKRLVDEGKVDQGDLMKIAGGGADIAGTIMSPAFLKLAKVLPAAKNLWQMAAQGVGVGALGGALAPTGSADLKEKAIATGTGAAVGGVATPIISVAGRMATNAIAPIFSDAAAERGAARLMSKVVGPQRQSIVAQAFSGASPKQTAAEAALPLGFYEVPAVQRLVGQGLMPSEYGAVKVAAERGREAALQGVTPDAAAAVAARQAATAPMYDAAKRSLVDTRPIIAEIDKKLLRVADNNPLKAELERLRGGLVDRATGKPFANAERVMSAIDGLKGSIANKDNKFIQKNLMELRDDLKNAIPGYSAADARFAQMSSPINQANVLERMQSELRKPTDAGERVSAFLNVLGKGEDALIKKSTGMPRYVSGDLQKILDPKQMAVVDDIVGQLKQGAEISRQEREGMTAAVKAMKAELDPNTAPNLLNAKVSLFNAILRMLEGTGGKKVEKALARMMLPGEVPRLGRLMQEYQANPAGMMSIPSRMAGIPASVAATGMFGERE